MEEKIKNYKTAPFDARFPNTNQTRNCFQNYLGKGEEKFCPKKNKSIVDKTSIHNLSNFPKFHSSVRSTLANFYIHLFPITGLLKPSNHSHVIL